MFRVYERTIAPLTGGSPAHARGRVTPSKVCRTLEAVTLVGAVLCFVMLGVLHVEFQGQAGCLPGAWNRTVGLVPHTVEDEVVHSDVILHLFVPKDGSTQLFPNGSAPGDAAYAAVYEFSKTPSLLYLDAITRDIHNFTR